MPSNRKSSNKKGNSKVCSSQPADEPRKSQNSADAVCNASSETSTNQLIMPKHLAIPAIPTDSEIFFEAIFFAYTSVMLALQYLILYRTVWWLPHSYTQYAMNFHLIDTNLVTFILILMSRRLIWSIVKKFINYLVVPKARKLCQNIFQWIIYLTIFGLLNWYIWKIIQTHSIVRVFYLCFPLIVYLVLFKGNVRLLFELLPLAPPRNIKVQKVRYATNLATPEIYHTCSVSAEAIRGEVEYLKNDFNNRMKVVLFNSFISAYFIGFLPCCFAQNSLLYDVYFSIQHMIFVWIGCFLFCLVQVFPPRYCDVLHCSACHLGNWTRVSGRIPPCGSTSGNVTAKWTDAVFWQNGVVVKYMKDTYKSNGIINAAEPGNLTQKRFYTFFRNPSILWKCILTLEIALIIVQMVQLARASEWYHITSLLFVLMSNYYTLFKLVRDYLILWKGYDAEEMLQQQK